MSDWKPPKDVKPWMVCAACFQDYAIGTGTTCGDGYLVLGARHWDEVMRGQAKYIGPEDMLDWDQGFIDQWGRFYTREEAMECVKASGQPFNLERNGGQDRELFSEGLY